MPEIVCSTCRIPFREIENLGAWKCREYKVFNCAENRMVRIPGDHEGPYKVKDNVVVTPSAMQWLVGVNPRAKVFTENVAPTGYPEGATIYNVYENVVIQRFDPDAYAKTQQKYPSSKHIHTTPITWRIW